MRHSPLSRLEQLVKRVVEEPFNRLADEQPRPAMLALHCIQALEEGWDGEHVPNRFTISMHPMERAILSGDETAWEEVIAQQVQELAGQAGYWFAEPPQINLVGDHAVARGQTRIKMNYEPGRVPTATEILTLEQSDALADAIRSVDAFLIVQGRNHVPLNRPVIRIGRRVDNDIVLDSSSVSRRHAQIRWRQRYFVLFNLSKSGRTLVNGLPVQEHVLRPGDVIALSDALLVYGEERENLHEGFAGDDANTADTVLKPPG